MSAAYPWQFEGACPNCGHDESRHEWGGGGITTNVTILYCEVPECDCGYFDGKDKPDDYVGWVGGRSGRRG